MDFNVQDLFTESDVEQKIIYPLLTKILGYNDSEIKTKTYLAPTEIDKGAGKKIGYYPDYLIYIAGIPVLVIEAKKPSESEDTGYREGRLYANEINKNYNTGVNPVGSIISTNGITISFGKVDSEAEINKGSVCDLLHGTELLEDLKKCAARNILYSTAMQIRNRILSPKKFKPFDALGRSISKNEIKTNSFAIDLIPVLKRYFNPEVTSSPDDILINGYCNSDEKTQYEKTIDALLEHGVSEYDSLSHIKTSGYSASNFDLAVHNICKTAYINPDPMLLIVGGVGSGKTMFLHRYVKFCLSEEIRNKTEWVIINANEAPVSESLEKWICTCINDNFIHNYFGKRYLDYELQIQIFKNKIEELEFGSFKRLKEINLSEYEIKLSEKLSQWMEDSEILCNAIINYIKNDKMKYVIIAIDNVDKLDVSRQLSIFETIQWFRSKNKCFTIMSLRGETYDTYKNKPPLDTIIKSFAFRINPPRFTNVAEKRIKLAIEYIKNDLSKEMTYTLENGIRVQYPARKIEMYLSNLYSAIFHPRKKVRIVLEALSGKNIRNGLEMFTTILSSGYIDENKILSTTEGGGVDAFPEWLVIRILMKTKYKYYTEEHGYLVNIFSTNPDSKAPNIFTIPEVLKYLSLNRKKIVALGNPGFIPVSEIISYMDLLGITEEDILWSLNHVIKKGLIVNDSQNDTVISNKCSVSITASGHFHISFFPKREEYISNVAFDTYISSEDIANRIRDFSEDTKYSKMKRISLFKESLKNEYDMLCESLPQYKDVQNISEQLIFNFKEIFKFKQTSPYCAQDDSWLTD